MRAGYAYAHIGSALSLIDSVASGRASGVNEVITQYPGNLTMWSGSDSSENFKTHGQKLTFVYQETYDERLEKDTLSFLWMVNPVSDRKNTCFLFVRDESGRPEAFRYTNKKGWHTPPVRSLRKMFHNHVSPLAKSDTIVGRMGILQDHDYQLFARTMEQFRGAMLIDT